MLRRRASSNEMQVIRSRAIWPTMPERGAESRHSRFLSNVVREWQMWGGVSGCGCVRVFQLCRKPIALPDKWYAFLWSRFEREIGRSNAARLRLPAGRPVHYRTTPQCHLTTSYVDFQHLLQHTKRCTLPTSRIISDLI